MSIPFGEPEASFSFDHMIRYFHHVMDGLPDHRPGHNTRYQIKDAVLGAFSVFFTQCPSFLAFQRTLAQNKGQSNAQTLFQIRQIPSDNRIRTLLDPIAPSYFFPVFESLWQGLAHHGRLEPFQSVNGTLLVALDGTEYFRSQTIHCPQCTHTHHRNGTVSYSHQAITPALVAPSCPHVVPLPPVFITPQDGHDKQDCETAAAKRWLAEWPARYNQWPLTILGDDRYCHQPLCEAILDAQCHFILVCKPESHKTLTDWVSGMPMDTVTVRRRRGKTYEVDTYRFVNQVPLRDGKDALQVNGCEVTTTDAQGKILYRHSFATDFQITPDNVIEIVTAGRARWKIENENNNVLKTKGYHLEHNFGHGKQHLSSTLATLNLLAFLFHTVLDLLDDKYQLIRATLPTRQTFFDDLRALTRYLCFPSWEALLDFMIRGLELAPPDTG